MEQLKDLKTKLFGSLGGKGPLIAIEKGTSSLKVVIANSRKDSLQIEDFLVEDFGLIEEGARLGLAKERLAGFLNEKNINSGQAFIVVEDEAVFSTRLTLPLLGAKELRRAISWEIKDILPFPENEAISDWHLVKEIQNPDGSKSLELIFIAIHKGIVNDSISLLDGLNLVLESVNIVPGTLLNIVNQAAGFNTKEPVAVLELGYNHTGISIFKENKLIFMRRLSIGSSDITNALLGAVSTERGVVKLSYNDAEKIKQEYGVLTEGTKIEISNSNIDSFRLSSMMRPVLERMVAEIRNSFMYLSEKLQESYVTRIYLTGRGAQLKNIESFFHQQLGIPVELISVEGAVTLGPNITQERKSELGYLATTIGALLGAGRGLDFLPLELRHKKRLAIEWMALRLITFTVALVSFVSYLYIFVADIHYNNRAKFIKLNEKTLQSLVEVKEEIDTVQKLVSTIKGTQPSGTVIMKELSTATPTEAVLDMIDYSVGPDGTLRLKGIIYGDEKLATPILSKYIKILEDSYLFEGVNLVSSSAAGTEEEPILNFSINAKLELRK